MTVTAFPIRDRMADAAATLTYDEACRECDRLIQVLAGRAARRIIGETTFRMTPPEDLERCVLAEVEDFREFFAKAPNVSERDVTISVDFFRAAVVRECNRIAKAMHWDGGAA